MEDKQKQYIAKAYKDGAYQCEKTGTLDEVGKWVDDLNSTRKADWFDMEALSEPVPNV